MALLEVKDLHVSFNTDDGVVRAVRGISFEVERGKTLGIVGESGSGKSVSTQTLAGLTRGATVSGSAIFDGVDLITATPSQRRAVLGNKIGMIFQDPLTSLHPSYRVGWQIIEMIRGHDTKITKKQARQRAIDLLGMVGIPFPSQRVDDFPHQFSGGMRQRVMIAMAMALDPALLIADEPTTALDVTVQAQVLELMRKVQDEFGTAIILITHDLGVIADVADEVAVMYAGTIVERAQRNELFAAPHHPYTEGLLDSMPSRVKRGEPLRPVKGVPPSLINLPPGCVFQPRCPYAFDRCDKEVPLLGPVSRSELHLSACFLAPSTEEREALRQRRLGAEAAR
ncbi:ABC transporter ATP-binding protein [Nocardioides baekrokdamisoli]|uniref:ABC transporter ATP-binding protein n=1 Tax=Nocardioides baekrokdamisoli TaxID=1804624 RepID=A0A3G9ID68_9ACTN|nr:ABC transporter ATP-binding protein [Nocardioides baekrokdamisoli]BBH16322.1 ABC transporter ATP-binding protein [Nocardioides baekrokdamisoli]